MAENMMNSAHKASSDTYREGWNRVFNKGAETADCKTCRFEEWVSQNGWPCSACFKFGRWEAK